jgi:hypothetical protein
MLPAPDDRLIDPQLPAQFSEGDLLSKSSGNLLSLELGAEEAPTIRTPPLCFHRTILS